MPISTNKLQHLRSAVATSVPTAGQVLDGQIVINTADRLLFIKDSTGAIVAVASASAVTKALSSVQTVNGKVGPTVVLAPADIGTNGVAPLDSGGKILVANLPASILGAVTYEGTWDASTNTPTLPDPTASKGFYFVVTTAGTQFGITFTVGDWVISNGVAWQKVDATATVTSVNGKTGALTVTSSDVNALNLTTGGTVAGATTFSVPVTVPNGVAATDTTNLSQVQSLIAAAPGSGGTVTSINVAVPSILTSAGGPVTTTGTITLGLATQAANTVFAGPATGATSSPTFRALVAADIPALDEGTYA